jgi:hypothetical protein
MITTTDEKILKEKGISVSRMVEQLESFKKGFPFLKIERAAEPGKGILLVSAEEIPFLLKEWDEYLLTDAFILKFVPASGAASRMFKDLFEFLEKTKNEPFNSFEQKFFSEIDQFAFYEDLNKMCIKNEGQTIDELMMNKQYKGIVENLLLEKGLNYGSLPKGLLKFHTYPDEIRTPMQEHLVEGALYAATASGKVNIHFTVSGEHRSMFEKHFEESVRRFGPKFHVDYNVSFSEQKPSTDTIAADKSNEPFRDNDGGLVFRPGGHGALIENLNDLDGDVIFIKNIDNVVPDSLKESTITYKKIIAGILVNLQKQCFGYLKAKLAVISKFCEVRLMNHHPDLQSLSEKELRKYLYTKLNRPIRVCGMVKNVGEPGGGPFLTVNADGTVSPQIVESSQIDMTNPVDKAIMMKSTHFNPVDLVCGVKDYLGRKFNLLEHVDKNTGFISFKSKNGRELKALELPGLWNGAMSDWNTVFVDIPIETFNPVKTVNDLLRPQHQ